MNDHAKLPWSTPTYRVIEERGLSDHRNGDRTDNRPTNLREATHSENMRNRAVSLLRRAASILEDHPELRAWVTALADEWERNL